MCFFIDDTASVFRFSQLAKCLMDIAEWKDFDPDALAPYDGPVWIGYDPSRSRSDLTGHADAAWAIMHALINEDDNGEGKCSIAFAA